MFAVAKVSVLFGLFRHVSPLKGPENLTPVEDGLDASFENRELRPVCVAKVRRTFPEGPAMRNTIEELPIAPCHLTVARAISCMRKVIHNPAGVVPKNRRLSMSLPVSSLQLNMSYYPRSSPSCQIG
jgi:hypothetical protein